MVRPARPPRNCNSREWRSYMLALDTFHKSTGFAPEKEARP